ncbi:MAG: DNA internalization-related competence protein ComEC/Rec2 [Proteobacteria bacterium]|nr:DNA internalization-related competence protein ComEC/Rec2 [Pseudomonadota bacterium]
MFITAVLSFIAGIYLQTIYAVTLVPLVVSLFAITMVIPFVLSKKRRFSMVLILICFVLAGMIRIGIVLSSKQPDIATEEPTIFAGTVVESSRQIKTIGLSSPLPLKGIKAVFRTDDNLGISDSVRIYGQMKEFAPTFKNPYITSWKWLKRLEGTHYEIKGTVLSVEPGQNIIQQARNAIKKKIEESGAKEYGIIKALTIGDKTSLEDNTKTLFLKTGTSHILAISGLHVGIIAGFFFILVRWLLGRSYALRLSGRDKKYASLIVIPFAFIFMLLSGSGVSTIRATIMITIFMLSLFFERQREPVNTIALSALIILLLYPHSLFMPSFQLSFMSVLFIVIIMQRLYPLIRERNKGIKWFFSSILTTSTATIGTLPIVIYHFYGVNPLCMIHNLVSIPLMCMVSIPVSLMGIIVPYGEYLLRLAGEIININVAILNYINVGYIFPVIRPGLFETLLFYALILCIIFLNKKPLRRILYFAVIPLIIVSVIFACEKRFNNRLCFDLIDVGLGEAILIEAPKGIRILIDGGSDYRGNFDTGRTIITPILLSKKILTLDYVINTHPHGDHIGGLPSILNTFHVNAFATSGYSVNDEHFSEVLKIIREKGIELQLWKQGDAFTLRDNVNIQVMHPPSGYPAENPNKSSLVLKFIYKDTAFLMTGDIESDIEEMLIMSHMSLKANILKIPHHGSKNSSSVAFLRAVKPDLAIMSVGAGIKGLPGKEALDRYKELSIPVLSTQDNGFIQVCSDGGRITYKTFK